MNSRLLSITLIASSLLLSSSFASAQTLLTCSYGNNKTALVLSQEIYSATPQIVINDAAIANELSTNAVKVTTPFLFSVVKTAATQQYPNGYYDGILAINSSGFIFNYESNPNNSAANGWRITAANKVGIKATPAFDSNETIVIYPTTQNWFFPASNCQ